ncbi:MAG: system adenine-specific DNA-methyltransferase PglX [Planctomycetota bacterium]
MAFDQATRNRLQRFVNDARRVLEEEFTRQLQNDYGMDPNAGTVAELASLRHINDAQRESARILRDTLAHYTASGDMDAKQGLDRIVREQAFTVLNRMAALRMAESRGLLVESVGNGFQAKGFQLYARLAGTGLGETGDAYRTYLFSVFDELSQDLPGLFDRYSPQGRLFPREAALLQVLNLINDAEIAPLWSEDETIGWIYQYFNSKEERKAMRDASQAPRNSRELAVRNQFFTPRYVVEFLVDNTLGRLWFNATGGNTYLRERCQYLLVKPDETATLQKQGAATKLRDPRTLKLLDPACGSMHFGLYAFDLFAEIYREAWAWELQHGPGSLDISTQTQVALKSLSQTYEDEAAFLRDVPRLIIEHNIYGVDIDPRAAQIASLALWLRAQRAWHDEGVKAKERPMIGRGHVVAAIAPPAERELRQQFAASLDQRDAELFEKTLQLLRGLPELGVLLQAERELPHLIRQVYVGKGTGLFAQQEQESWQQAGVRLHVALTEFAQAAKSNYQGRLFAQDALQGLRLIDLCREVFDVVVMNPPFGEISVRTADYVDRAFPYHSNNLICAFVERTAQLLATGGRCGSVIDRTVLIKNSYQNFRTDLLLRNQALEIVGELGWGVLDANVEVSSVVFSQGNQSFGLAFGVDITKETDKPGALLTAIRQPVELSHEALLEQPFSAINFQLPDFLRIALKEGKSLSGNGVTFYNGHTIKSDVFKRLFWEVEPNAFVHRVKRMWNGSEYSPFYVPFQECVITEGYAGDLVNHPSTILRSPTRHLQAGLCFGKRGEYLDVQPLPPGFILTNEGFGAPIEPNDTTWYVLGLVNSLVIQSGINFYCGQHKGVGYVNAFPLILADDTARTRLVDISRKIYAEMRLASEGLETDPFFCRPPIAIQRAEWVANYLRVGEKVGRLINELDELAASIYKLNHEEKNDIFSAASNRPSVLPILGVDWKSTSSPSQFWAHSAVSFLVGCIYGRWDIRCASNADAEMNFNPWLPIPEHQPASLKIASDVNTASGNVPERYQLKVDWQGVLVDEVGHDMDIVGRVEQALRIIWGSKADDTEAEICSLLEKTRLRNYLAQPNGFFADHLYRYSKSRRQAPIYWPISTNSGSYTLWIYYHSLSNQTLYTAFNDFIEPKLKQVGGDVTALRNKGSARTRDDEKQFEALQAFELELIELRDTLLKLAPTYKPNHDDGVQISAAPLWPLFRHKPWQKVLKDTWAKLEKGDYDWAHLAMSYWPERVREKCRSDKSLAIAHGLEDLYIEPEAKPKKVRGKKNAGGDE